MAARAKQGAANALKAPGPTSQVDYHMSCAEDRFEHYQKQLFFIFFPELFAEEFMLVAWAALMTGKSGAIEGTRKASRYPSHCFRRRPAFPSILYFETFYHRAELPDLPHFKLWVRSITSMMAPGCTLLQASRRWRQRCEVQTFELGSIRQLLSIDASGRPNFQRLRNRAVKEFMMALGYEGDELGQLDLMPLTKGIWPYLNYIIDSEIYSYFKLAFWVKPNRLAAEASTKTAAASHVAATEMKRAAARASHAAGWVACHRTLP